MGELIGGLAFLSGYLNKVRSEEENVLHVIAGDMVQGSLIDSGYKGISTIEIMNYLSPDVVTLGNHELDSGSSTSSFWTSPANFPIVNANLYIKKYHKRLMVPHVILKKAGFKHPLYQHYYRESHGLNRPGLRDREFYFP